MKIKCEYCDGMFDDTLEKCPNCGAPNANVRRSTSDQPTTIEGLVEWYQSKGLPPYETTRFFIGIDYKDPRAFGIYKDGNTGNYVVYKNKNDGSRAVRYEGTDEAYAVNEILTRLKQEILEQKSHNVKNGKPVTQSAPSIPVNTSNKKHRSTKGPLVLGALILICALSCIPCSLLAVVIDNLSKPQVGYYRYNDRIYYVTDTSDYPTWAMFNPDKNDWEKFYPEEKSDLTDGFKARSFFVSEGYTDDLPCSNVTDSLFYEDYCNNFHVDTGYYKYDNNTYYHNVNLSDYDWYYYDDDSDTWYEANIDDIPDELRHQSLADDFWYTPDWNTETQISDFEDTDYYKDLHGTNYTYSSSDDDDNDSWWNSSSSSWDDDDDDDYSWSSSSDDDWDSSSSDWDSDW